LSVFRDAILRAYPSVVRTNVPTRITAALALQSASSRLPDWTKLSLFYHRC
jgi:hypothetical protein